MSTKRARPRPFFMLGNKPKQPQILLKLRYFERGLSKTFQKVNFIFSYEPSPF